MSTPEQPATPALTRKQMRELRNTGSTPIIAAVPDATPAPEAAETAPPVVPAPVVPAAVSPAPFPRPAEPVAVPPAPIADAAVDLGVSPLTRRQARQQERIRTASVPVITPEVVAAHAAAQSAPPAFAFAPAPAAPVPFAMEEPEESVVTASESDAAAEISTDSGIHALFGIQEDAGEPERESVEVSAPESQGSIQEPESTSGAVETSERALAPAFEALPASIAEPQSGFDDVLAASDRSPSAAEAEAEAKAVVNPAFGAGLLSVEPTAPVEQPAGDLPATFDQLLSRSTGATPLPNTFIVTQAPEVAPLVAPLTATGEVLVTGSFQLPEGLGSTGHAKGTADGKEIDATLVDGELPSHSSPTPIAASAAVSTVKMPGEVIKPPVPEKSSKLMMTLAITAGVLGLALVGVLILAFATGAL